MSTPQDNGLKAPRRSGFDLHVLERPRVDKQWDQAQARYRRPWSRGREKTEFPDRDKACLIVQFPLDLVQQCCSFLAVALHRLPGVPLVDLRVFDPRVRPSAMGESLQPGGGVAVGAASLECQVLQRLFPMGGRKGGPFQWTHPGSNT